MSATATPRREPTPLEHSGGFVAHAGLVVDEVAADRVTGHIDLGVEHHTPWGIVHGGVYADRDRERREHRGDHRGL